MSKPVTLFFLQASRSIRTAWLLEELGVPYTVEFADRQNQKAPQEFKDRSGNPLGKFPSINDNGVNVYESGAIADFLIEKYDKDGKMLPKSQPARTQAQIWTHAAEGTFMMHALAIMYARWQFPKDADKAILAQQEKGMSVNVNRDFDWLEQELTKNPGPFLLGAKPTVADVMMQVSIEFIQEREIGVKKGQGWPKIQEWLKACLATEGYQRAVERTGHTLHPKTT